MRLLRSAKLFALTFTALTFAIPASAFAQDLSRPQKAGSDGLKPAPPANCPITLPTAANFTPPYPVPKSAAAQFGLTAAGKFGTEKLWTVLPIDGVWRGPIPKRHGQYAYSDKHPWFRVHPAFSLKDGLLTVTGERLDGSGPSFIETYQGGGLVRDDDNAMIMGAMQIPVFGCWRITGSYADQELSFVVWVAPRSPHESDSAIENSLRPSAVQGNSLRVHVDGDIQAKSIVYRVTPEIPHEAQVVNTSDDPVVLRAVIDRDGRPIELQYLSGPPLLAQPAIDAVTWWQYSITESVEIETTIKVEFAPHKN
jgi:hypothetical protein